MSRYRWDRPHSCIESMEYFPALKGADYATRSAQLFNAVSRGDVQVMLNDAIVPKSHIAIYLSLYARATPDQEPNTMPPDLAVNLDDLSAVFDRPNADARKPGRPRKVENGWSVDRHLVLEMHKMIARPPDSKLANTAAEAARLLVNSGRVSGAGTPENKAKRLVRLFRIYYSS
jgi:hypothetical protein